MMAHVSNASPRLAHFGHSLPTKLPSFLRTLPHESLLCSRKGVPSERTLSRIHGLSQAPASPFTAASRQVLSLVTSASSDDVEGAREAESVRNLGLGENSLQKAIKMVATVVAILIPVAVQSLASPAAALAGSTSAGSIAAAPAKASLNLADIGQNSIFMASLVAWALAQGLKVFTKFWAVRQWDWKMLFASGGMPSSHSAMCCSLTASVALLYGFNGPLFPICLAFTLIVMYDATSVRYHAGVQAQVLNVVVAEMLQGHPVSEQKLKELLGHTPLQVAAGASLGVIASYLYHVKKGLI